MGVPALLSSLEEGLKVKIPKQKTVLAWSKAPISYCVCADQELNTLFSFSYKRILERRKKSQRKEQSLLQTGAHSERSVISLPSGGKFISV